MRENLKAMEPSFVVYPEVKGSLISINRDMCVSVKPSKKNDQHCTFTMADGSTIEIDLVFSDIFATLEDPDNGQ